MPSRGRPDASTGARDAAILGAKNPEARPLTEWHAPTIEARAADDVPTAEGRADTRVLLVAIALVVVGTCLRLLYLNARGSFWLDELYSVWAATRPSIPAVLTELVTDPHPPGYTLFLHGWLGLVGVPNEAVARLPSLFAAVVMLALVAALAPRVMCRRAALVWLALLAVSPMAIAYSAEARPYALLLLIQSVVVIASLGARAAPSSGRWWLLLFIAVFLASSVHYFGALASGINAAAFGLVVFRDRRDRLELLRWAGVGVAAVGPSAAWILSTMALGGGPFTLTAWLKEPGAETIVRDVLAVFGQRRRDLIVAAALLSAGLVAACVAWRRGARPKAGSATPLVVPLAMVVIATYAFALVVSWVRPIWSGRYFIELIPYALLIVALAADRAAGAIPDGWPRATVVGAILAVVLAAGITSKPRAPGLQDWRSAALEAMQRYEGPDTLVVAYGPSSYELDQFWQIYTSSILAGRGPAIPAAAIVHVDPAGLPALDLADRSQVLWLSGHFPMGDQPQAVSDAAGLRCVRRDFVKASVLDCRPP